MVKAHQIKLVVIDGNAILHRAYHALPPLTSRSGQIVNAVYGFCTMLFRIVGDLKPTHLAVAFDTEKPTFRHAAYVGYQAQRPRMESDLAQQIETVQDVLGAMDIPIYIAPGFEADDVIGTLTKQGFLKSKVPPAARLAKGGKSQKSKVGEIVIVSGDRDLLQLVGKNVRAYVPIKGLSEAYLFDERGVEKYMGVLPTGIVDYKALVGDPSDNYPGVPGVGPKTAVSLLEKFGSLEEIYKNLGKIEPTLVSKLSEGHQSALLSQELAKIRTDAPVSLDLAKAELKSFSGNKELLDKFRELGFKSLVARLEPKKTQEKKVRRGQQLKLVS